VVDRLDPSGAAVGLEAVAPFVDEPQHRRRHLVVSRGPVHELVLEPESFDQDEFALDGSADAAETGGDFVDGIAFHLSQGDGAKGGIAGRVEPGQADGKLLRQFGREVG
jgi:hypothetical protein